MLDGWFTCDGCAQDYLLTKRTRVVDHVKESTWWFCADCLDWYYLHWSEVGVK